MPIVPPPPIVVQCPNPVPIGLNNITLANATAMKELKTSGTREDPLDAFIEGRDDEANVDMYLNLPNIEDVKMSTDSSKRKRCEESEETTSPSSAGFA